MSTLTTEQAKNRNVRIYAKRRGKPDAQDVKCNACGNFYTPHGLRDHDPSCIERRRAADERKRAQA